MTPHKLLSEAELAEIEYRHKSDQNLIDTGSSEVSHLAHEDRFQLLSHIAAQAAEIERLKALLRSRGIIYEPGTCAMCGNTPDKHPYRHPFIPVKSERR